MSELLRLRQWLSGDEVVRLVQTLGISNAEYEDIYSAYAEAGFPLRFSNLEISLYKLKLDDEESGYPFEATSALPDCIPEIEHVCHVGKLWQVPFKQDIDPENSFYYHATSEMALFTNCLPTSDLQDRTFYPLYLGSIGADCMEFSLVTWGFLRGEAAYESLEFSRPHLEKLVRRALGEVDTETSAPGEDRSASANLLGSAPAGMPEYLSPGHNCYPPELHAAVLLWTGLYVNNERNPLHSHSQAAAIWLKSNERILPTKHLAIQGSDAFVKRLTTVTQPDAKKPKKQEEPQG